MLSPLAEALQHEPTDTDHNQCRAYRQGSAAPERKVSDGAPITALSQTQSSADKRESEIRKTVTLSSSA